jgi:DNA polymerase-4
VKEGTILHADADAFFAAVEQRDDPKLRDRPVAVGVGVVMAASYEARAYGVHGGMGGTRARRLCPGLVAVPPRFSAYTEASRALFGLFRETSPLVEGLSLEEAFIDVRGLERIKGTPLEIAARLRRDVRERIGLAVTIGVGSTRMVAKMASRTAKPDGLLAVPAVHELAFLHSLPVEQLWGVGPSMAAKLHARGLRTVAELARAGEEDLMAAVGASAGRWLAAVARNRETRRVRSSPGRRSFGSQSAMGRSRRTAEEVDARLAALVDRVTRRMRAAGRIGRTVVLRLRFRDFSRATRSRTLAQATAGSATILVAARSLLDEARPTIARRGLTLIGVTVTNLSPVGSGVQLELPYGSPNRGSLDAALDEVRDRYGPEAIKRAASLRAGPELEPWLRPGEEPKDRRRG